VFGLGALVDGGFGMGQDLPLFAAGETDQSDLSLQSETIVNGKGETSTVQKKAKFGSASSGGLY
jgi:penicillin-binding protein 1A